MKHEQLRKLYQMAFDEKTYLCDSLTEKYSELKEIVAKMIDLNWSTVSHLLQSVYIEEKSFETFIALILIMGGKIYD